MMEIVDIIQSKSPCWAHVFVGEKQKLTNLAWSAENSKSGIALRFLRGSKMKSTANLFDEFASALQFPYYFGNNWNAFDECLADLSWLPSNYYLLCITDAESVLENDDEQLSLWLSTFARVTKEWSVADEFRLAASFHVIFQVEESLKTTLFSRLDQFGIQYDYC